MADEKIVTSIVANSDFSGLIADVQRVTNSLHKLQQEFAGSNRALAGQIDAANAMFNQTMLKTGQFSSHFVSLTSDVEKFGRNLDSGRLKLRDYFRVYQDHMRTSGGLIRELAQQQVQLQNAVLQPLGKNAQGLMQYNVHIPRGLDLTKNKSALLKQELQIMNKVIQDGGVQLINWGKNTQWAGRQLTVGLTLPLVAFGKAAADAFKVADQELTRLTKVYGDVAGTSAQELGRVRKEVAQTAKELSASMGVNFAETIGLAADIAATGKTGNELLSSVSETTRLAVLGEVDRQEAMKATLAIQSAFKQNTEELAESINFLNAVENQTSTTLNDLVEAIPKAGPVIKGLGGNVEDLALYLTAMREGGINASEGANALKSALASLINPTDVAVKKFQGFGIDLLGIVQKNAGSTTDTLFALQAALDRLDPLSKQQAIEQLFGKFQYSRLNALFENLGRQGSQTLQVLDLMKASASELESVANRELAAVTESAAGRYKRAVESLKASLAGVGDDFLNIATKLINVLNKIVEFGQKLPDPIKKIMAFGGAFTAIIGPVIMLTGVLANFFGYIIKGLGHFKALFKGAEGFKLLTPEIIAARNASSLLSDEFYSDAKAADTLRLAIEKLNNDLVGLQINATNATRASSGLGQVLATSAGVPIMPMGSMGAPRVAIPEHPLIGGYSRAAAHLNPRDPNDPSTIFGLTLQPIPLNRRIGRTPQVIMSERLPDIEGVTSVGGMSTGVVAGEHARYAALMATLGMQSRQEIEALKKTIGLGGQVSTEFIATFDDILPMTQRLTANAAAQSAAIVADLRAGKITAQQALAAIVAANAELERMMGVEITAYATSRGRSIDLTKAPLIDQPVVDVAGKPNTRGMYRTGIFADVMAAVGKATKTKTYGGPYSIETTRRLNKGGNVRGYSGGGDVFYNNGDQVPGPSINADVVPAMLTPGEFVIRRDVAQQDPDGMRALNEGRAVVVPVVNANRGGEIPGYRLGNFVRAATASRTRDIAITGRFGSHSWRARNAATGAQIDDYLMSIPDPIERMRAAAVIENFAGTITTGRSGVLGRARYAGVIQPGHISREEVGLSAILQANGLPPMTLKLRTHQTHLTRSSLPIGGGQRYVSRYVADYDWLSNLQAKTGKLKVGNFISRNIGRKNKYNTLFEQAGIPEEKWSFVENQVDEALAQMLAGKEEQFIGDNYGDLIFERDFVPVIDQVMINNGGSPSQITAMKRNTVVRGSGKSSPFGKEFRRIFNLNRGGMVPGYNGGGGVSRATLLARLGAKFKYTGKSYEGKDALQVYRFNAMDVDGGKKYFGHIEGLSDKARGALYASTLEFFNTSMIKGDRVGGKRMFMPRSFLTAMPTIAANALTWNKDIMTPEDILILEGIKGKGVTLGGSVGSSMALSKVYKDVFRANRGGMVPGYAGGGPAQYGYARGVQNRFLGGGILRMLAALGIMQAGTQVGQRVGGGAGAAISTASSFLPFMFMGMPGGGNAFRTAPTIAQRLGRTTEFTTNLGAFGTPLSAANPLVTANAVQQISPLKQSIFAQGTPVLGKAAGGVERLATSTNALSRGLGKVLLGATRFNVALGLVTGAVIFGIKKWNEYKEGLERTRLASGLTEESAGKLGLKFKNLSSEIKATLDTYNLWTASNKAAYQGMTAANAPFRMTIADYKKLRKEVKGTMQDQIDLINNTDKADLSRLAIQLKAMFMSAGMSAEEASKKIYMAFALSNKAAQAAQSTVGNVGFNEITDSASAAKAAVETFNYVVGQTFDKEARANAFQTAWLGIVNAIEDATRKAEENAQKNGKNFDEQQVRLDEQNKLLNELSKLKLEPIGQRALDQLAAADVSILKLANSLDTVVSLQQKLSLLKDFGFAGNLANYSPEAAAKLYAQANAIRQQVEEKNREIALKGEYAELKVLKDKATTLENAAKGEKVRVQINRRERIKALQEEIKKINESADARKKALQEEAEDQDTNLEIQKKRLEYQQMLAAGDFGGAAQAQLDLQQLTNRQQRTLTEREIDARREADIKPLQKEIDSLNDAAQKMADNAAIASESLDKLNKKIKDQQDKIDGFNKAASSYILNQQNNTGKLKDISAGLVDIGTKLGISKDKLDEYVKSLQTTILDNYTGKLGKAVNTIPTPSAEDVSRYRSLLRNTPGDPLTGTPGAALVFNKNTGRWQLVKGYENVNLVSKENTVSYQQWESGYKKYSTGGPIQHFGPGGDVNGPGTATSDSIPAMLSDGEYVIRAAAVDHYGVDTFHALNAKKLKDGGPVGKDKSNYQDTVNLDGQILRVNRGTRKQILADIKAAYAAEPNVKAFKDRADYFKAIQEWNDKYSFVIPSTSSYPIPKNEYPLGSLSRFLSVAESQAAGASYNAFYDANIASHAFKSFTPQVDRQVKELLSTSPDEVFNRLGELEQLNKFSIEANKKYKLSSDLIAWCGAFVAWVAEQSGVDISKKMFSAFSATKEYKDLGLFKDPSSSLNVGDIIWWDWAKKFRPGTPKYKDATPGIPDHVDIITGKSGKSMFTTIGGGFGGSVGKKTRDFSKEAGSLFGSVTPNFLSFKDGGEVKKQNWFQRYVSRLTKSQDEAQKTLSGSPFTSWMSSDPLGVGALLRKFAGQGRKGDTLAATLLPLNFMGFGLGRTAATTAAKGASNISNLSAYEKSFAINQIDNEALKSVMNTSLDDILKALPQDERKLIFASLGNARGSASFLKNLGLKTMAENYPKYDFNDPLSFVKNEQPSSILQALREVELLKQSSELRSAWSELLKESEKKVKDYSFMLGKPDKYGDPITESMLIARGAKTTEPEFVSLYNKEYAKLFYGIKNDPEIGIFKGGYSDPSATSSGGWKTSQGQLGTFFSTNPYVAKMFSEAIGGGPENMFSATMPLSKLPTALHSPFDSYNAEWTQFLTPTVLKDLIESGNLSRYPFRNFLKDAESIVGKASGGYIQKFKNGGKIKPIFGTPDPTQGFLNELLFGTRYVGGPSPVIKGEVPFGPGGVAKLASNSKWIQDELLFDVYRGIKGTLDKTRGLGMHWTTGASIGKGFAGRDIGTIIKGRVPISSIETNREALFQGGVFNPSSMSAYIRKLAEGEKEIPVASGAHMLIDAITKIRRVKDPSFIPNPGEYINPFSTIGTMLKSRTIKYKNPKIMQASGGGYVNPAYFSDMSMPSYFTGAKYVYNDTIAQLHKGEMVVPSGQNPNNPFAMDTAGGPININNNLTINATPGMDTDELVNKVFTKVEQATSLALAKTGRRRAI